MNTLRRWLLVALVALVAALNGCVIVYTFWRVLR